MSETTYNAVFTEFTTKLSKQLSRWGSLREILLSSHRDTGGSVSVTQLCECVCSVGCVHSGEYSLLSVHYGEIYLTEIQHDNPNLNNVFDNIR